MAKRFRAADINKISAAEIFWHARRQQQNGGLNEKTYAALHERLHDLHKQGRLPLERLLAFNEFNPIVTRNAGE